MKIARPAIILGCFAYMATGMFILSGADMATEVNTGLVLASGIAAMTLLLRRIEVAR